MRVDAATAIAAAEEFARQMQSRSRDYEPRHVAVKADDAGLAPRRPKGQPAPPDYTGKQREAERLAETIRAYWATQGRVVIAIPQRFNDGDGITGWTIRTTLKDGITR
jgi:hypothetical protein